MSYRDLKVWQIAMELVRSLMPKAAELGRMLNGLIATLEAGAP